MTDFTPINKPAVDTAKENAGGDAKTGVSVKPEAITEVTNKTGTKGKKKPGNEDKAPTTPRKRGRKPAASREAAGGEEKIKSEEDVTPSKKPKQSPAKRTPRPIPTSLDAASMEDKMLLRLRDEQSKPWTEIAHAWNELTGEETKGTTLSTRYMRIKASLAVLSKDHEALMLKFKREAEEKFEAEKWHRIADSMEQASGEKFPPLTLQKKFREMEKKSNVNNGLSV
ncbi:hypothetical protein LOZ66_004424 [Ophidiomyces ophidiicola]|nr:hypothetical protein LOZ66_004424 [Ophidiomyces ophidiicola]